MRKNNTDKNVLVILTATGIALCIIGVSLEQQSLTAATVVKCFGGLCLAAAMLVAAPSPTANDKTVVKKHTRKTADGKEVTVKRHERSRPHAFGLNGWNRYRQ